jgi:hypothetical protein
MKVEMGHITGRKYANIPWMESENKPRFIEAELSPMLSIPKY